MAPQANRLNFCEQKNLLLDLLEIFWPSGIIDRIQNVALDSIIRVREGEGEK